MKKEFTKRYSDLETMRKTLFNDLKKYSDEVINTKPEPNKWSVVEVLLHLIAAEEATLSYLQKKTMDTSIAKKSGLNSKIKYMLLQVAFNIPAKYKAPSVTKPKASKATLHELDEKWAKIRSETMAILEKLKDEDFSKELWLHPVTGKMSLMQMVDFLTMHFQRHQLQVVNTLKLVGA